MEVNWGWIRIFELNPIWLNKSRPLIPNLKFSESLNPGNPNSWKNHFIKSKVSNKIPMEHFKLENEDFDFGICFFFFGFFELRGIFGLFGLAKSNEFKLNVVSFLQSFGNTGLRLNFKWHINYDLKVMSHTVWLITTKANRVVVWGIGVKTRICWNVSRKTRRHKIIFIF